MRAERRQQLVHQLNTMLVVRPNYKGPLPLVVFKQRKCHWYGLVQLKRNWPRHLDLLHLRTLFMNHVIITSAYLDFNIVKLLLDLVKIDRNLGHE